MPLRSMDQSGKCKCSSEGGPQAPLFLARRWVERMILTLKGGWIEDARLPVQSIRHLTFFDLSAHFRWRIRRIPSQKSLQAHENRLSASPPPLIGVCGGLAYSPDRHHPLGWRTRR